MPDAWVLTDHACRVCMGRLLESNGVHRCAECGATTEGPVEDACWCGVEVPNHGKPFECVRNPIPGRNEVMVKERTKVA